MPSALSKPDFCADAAPSDLATLLRTLTFASEKHAFQVRKDPARTPYINHPIAVANFIAETGETDLVTLQAAILHDTVEDTDCSIDEIAGLFGTEVSGVVDECTDEAGVSSFRSKQAQIKTCPNKSRRAHQVKLADKLHNLLSIQKALPVGWDAERAQRYFLWAKTVTDICAPANPALAAQLETLYETGTFTYKGKKHPCLPKRPADLKGSRHVALYPPIPERLLRSDEP